MILTPFSTILPTYSWLKYANFLKTETNLQFKSPSHQIYPNVLRILYLFYSLPQNYHHLHHTLFFILLPLITFLHASLKHISTLINSFLKNRIAIEAWKEQLRVILIHSQTPHTKTLQTTVQEYCTIDLITNSKMNNYHCQATPPHL